MIEKTKHWYPMAIKASWAILLSLSINQQTSLYGQLKLDSTYLASLYDRQAAATFAGDLALQEVLIDSILELAPVLPHWDMYMEVSSLKAALKYRTGQQEEAWQILDHVVELEQSDTIVFSASTTSQFYYFVVALNPGNPAIQKANLDISYGIFLDHYKTDTNFQRDSILIAARYNHIQARIYLAYGLAERAYPFGVASDQLLDLGHHKGKLPPNYYELMKMVNWQLLQDISYQQNNFEEMKTILVQTEKNLDSYSQPYNRPNLTQALHKQWVRYYMVDKNYTKVLDHILLRQEVLSTHYTKENHEWVENQVARLDYDVAVDDRKHANLQLKKIVASIRDKDLRAIQVTMSINRVLRYYADHGLYQEGLELLRHFGIHGRIDNTTHFFDVTSKDNILLLATIAEFYADYSNAYGDPTYLAYAHGVYNLFFEYAIDLARLKNIMHIVSDWNNINTIVDKAIAVNAQLYNSTNDTKYIKAIFNISQFLKSYELNQYLDLYQGITSDEFAEIRKISSPIKRKICQLSSAGIYTDTTYQEVQKLSLSLDLLLDDYANVNTNYEGIINYKLNTPSEYVAEYHEGHPGATIINYHVVDDTYYITTSTNDGWDLEEAPKNNILAEADDMVKLIGEYKSQDLVMELSTQLYAQLVHPIASKLSSLNVIMADEHLSRLPFEALVDDKDQFLIEKYSFANAESYLHLRYNDNDYSSNQVLSIAPGFIQEDDRIVPLKASVEEAIDVHNIMDGTLLIEDNAKKSNVMNQLLSCNIVHLASHAETDDRNPLLSKILLTHDDGRDKTSDPLYTHELLELDLSMKLVSLNACNTSSGLFREGRGMQSIAQAFNIAGARATLGTQWNAVDHSGKYILNEFYQHLNRGENKPDALRAAKLAYLDTNKDIPEFLHPYYWASYTLYGDISPIVKKTTWIYYLLGIGLILLLLYPIKKLLG